MNELTSSLRNYRIESFDYLRGLVIVIMAIDHARDYLGAGIVALDPMSDDASLSTYLTRLITHLCAPIFVALAGLSAGLMTARRSKAELAKLLITRGIWLIAIEFLIVSHLWTFSPTGISFALGAPEVVALSFQVIGAIGFAMIVLGVLQYFGPRTCLIIGLLVVMCHNGVTPLLPQPEVQPMGPPAGEWWQGLYAETMFNVGSFSIVFVYPAIQWLGIMLVGFGAAQAVTQYAQEDLRKLVVVAIGMLVAFVLLRSVNVYGDPNLWTDQGDWLLTLRDFFDVTKYPPSLLFNLLTLGAGLLLLAAFDHLPKSLARILIVYGRAPFVVYIAHLFLVHLSAIVLGLMQGYEASSFTTLYFMFPEGYGLPLWGVYVYWLLLMASLYPLAKWMGSLKARRKDWWLSYV